MKKLALLLIMLLTAVGLSAQGMPENIRYVSKNGAYANDGRSWASAKLNIQDAINDLVNDKLTGEVWVAEGVYTPTESTEASGGSTLYMSFKIPEGIVVRGGFAPNLTDAEDGVNDETTRPHKNYNSSIGWFYRYHTVLSGNLSSEAKFTWNTEKEQWNTTFYGNTYHVVWFATKGFDAEGRANPISNVNPKAAGLEGCVVTGGNAHNNTLAGRPHNAYGGGIYMVAGANVENCWIRNCSASRDGGGIYMDGGGYLEHSYVQDCQALGIGVQNGFGGGICVEGLAQPISMSEPYIQTNPVAYVIRTGITGCVGRMGGGIAYNTHDTRLKYNVCASAVLVSNNTATTEAGGVYVNRGAALTHMTIVNNKCNGTGITIGGMQTGRSAGLYVRDNAHVANSMLWGGKVGANNDIQYASSRSSVQEELKPSMQFSMLSKADYVDWSGTQKFNVEKLSEYNNLTALTNAGATKKESEAFPMFTHPTAEAGYIDYVGMQTITNLDANGVPTTADDAPKKAYNWQVNPRSAATHRGVLTYDLDLNHETPSKQMTYDIFGNLYTARVTIGAYNSRPVAGLPDMYALDAEGNKYMYDFTYDSGNGAFVDESKNPVDASAMKKIANLYVDPNEGDQEEQLYNSGSWDTPAKYLPDALYYIKTWWVIPEYAKYFSQLDEINVYVKEGTVYNTSAHFEGHVRNATIEIPHLKRYNSEKPIQLNIIGGMDKSLTGFDVSKRDPVHHPTVITGNIIDDYELNAAHLVTFNGCHDVTFDGFQVRYANARSTRLDNTDQNGAALYFKRNTEDTSNCDEGKLCKRIKVKNVLVAGCAAVNGTAVYALDNAQVDFENCIFHNNEAGESTPVGNTDKTGIIYAESGTSLAFNHCDVLRNVGYAFAGEGSISLSNSITYANMKKPLEDTNGQEEYALRPMATGTTLTGSSNMFDVQSGDVSALGQRIFTFNREDMATYPRFINPTKNAGVSPKGDITYYGRAISFEPTNINPMVNAASDADPNHLNWGTDMSSNTRRDFGGRPDIGAIENHVADSSEGENAYKDGQKAYGQVVYVRDYNTYNNDGSVNTADTSIDGRDGTSWSTAINGNALYYAGQEEHDVPVYSDVFKGYNISYTTGGKTYYLMINGLNLTTTNIQAQAGVFVLYDTSGNRLGEDAVIEGTRRLYDTKTDKYIYLDKSGSTYTFKSTTTAGNTSNATIDSEYRISMTNSSAMYLWYNSGLRAGSSTSTAWTFTKVTQNEQTGSNKETVEVFKSGLQHAIETQHKAFKDDGGNEENKRFVYVGEGKYTHRNQANSESLSQPYAFMMREGVDVYGGFPNTGNPGDEQRDPKKYVTILQPQTESPYITYNRPTEDGPNYRLSVTSWGANATYNDEDMAASMGRVVVQPDNFAVPTKWDGFTMRHGYLMTATMNNIGSKLTSSNSGEGLNPGEIINSSGAGVLLQENGILSNCKVIENLIACSPRNSKMITNGIHTDTQSSGRYTYHMAGAGIFMSGTLNSDGLCNGNGAIVENCEVGKNQIITKSQNLGSVNKFDNIWMYGGGIFQNGGQMYNTIVHDNDMITLPGNSGRNDSESQGLGNPNEMILGGVFIASGHFYNNTVVNNTAASLYSAHDNHCVFSGIHVFDNARIYNSIIADNYGRWYYTEGNSPGNGVPVSAFADNKADRNSRDASKIHVFYSFVDVNQGEDLIDLVSQNDTEHTNIYLNRTQGATTNDEDNTYTSDKIYYKAGGANTTSENIYKLFKNSPAVNSGTEAIDGVTIPSYDADYTARVQDCIIDMGAHEYNGSYDITPDLSSEADRAIFYVTPYGAGNASASSPANAACASKLQQVLDAAGRYKFLAANGKYGNDKKEIKVIVKVAASYSLAHNGDDSFDFHYSANRTTDESDDNARIWSIIVPHGVEVWGGYSDVHVDADGNKLSNDWNDTHNGFYTKEGGYKDLRNITKNVTVFDGEFTNLKENSVAHSYHTITFCDRVYDGEGHPYLEGDFVDGILADHSTFDKNNAPEEDGYLHMSDEKSVIDANGKRNHHRAVVDGIFISGGNANADNATNPLQSMGGAAVVTDFAHVRNCIITGNEAKQGGALALANRALVSGTLIYNNKADEGGAIYAIPNGVQLANSTTNNSTEAPDGMAMDWNMPHVFTSTIVGNSATKQGGGIYYANDDPNVRVNSCVIWNNDAPDQANVAGIVSPDKPQGDMNSTLAFYPFGYTAIQNLRASGANNIKVEAEADRGVRWNNLTLDHYYGLTDFSILARTGMPVGDYQELVNLMDLSPIDFAALERDIDIKSEGTRTFIDMGARAIDKAITHSQLMLRLFVAQPEDINMDAAAKLASLASKPEPKLTDYNLADYDNDEEQRQAAFDQDHYQWSIARYYAQEGSSFAYPMHSLQDALDYIYDARSIQGDGTLKWADANNLPFEICVARGIYYPTRDLSGNYGQSLANTFLIPEGVSIIGGFNVNGGSGSYYGRYNTAKDKGEWVEPSNALDPITKTYTTPTYYITDNVDKADLTPFVVLEGIRITHDDIELMKRNRDKADINANNIIEPWEFLNETVLDGNAVNADNTGVYHVITVVPDQQLVGALPTRSIEREAGYDPDATGHQWLDREEGQSINLNGLTVRGGQAFNFVEDALDEMSYFSYYHGGAMLIDGNRYNDNFNKKDDLKNGWSSTGETRYMHTGASNAVGYRDIPVAIAQCKFVNNKAGYGGAISTNTTVDIFSSAFEQNLAEAKEENGINHGGNTYDIQYPGEGGAVYSTHQFSAFNTIFANNEARDQNYAHGITPSKFLTLRNQDPSSATPILGGVGGAVYGGIKAQIHLVNCNIVRNMANAFPAVFTMNPNTAAQADPAGRGATITTPEYNQIVNTVAWGNEVNKNTYDAAGTNSYFKFSAGLICNFGPAGRTGAYEPNFVQDNMPKDQNDLDQNYEETAWFSAYEEGKGITQKNANDFRDAEYRPFRHCKLQFADFAAEKSYSEGYQNCNISLSPDNKDLEGPNFVNPSSEAGIAGYVESADWSPARLNKLTDNGSGKILQNITSDPANGYKYESVFPSYTEAGKTVPPERALFSEETSDNIVTSGVYPMTRFLKDYKHYNENLPLGNGFGEFYMQSANASSQQLLRISFDPNPTHDQTYIDIGVYEYPHTELAWHPEDECDIIWVSAGEKPENGLPDGSDWSQPTSDLQRAIETLLASRNGHRKEIRLLDGTYTPIYTIKGNLSFYIDTQYQNASVILPTEDDGLGGKRLIEGLGIKSLTIKGGYSDELENIYDLSQYPAVFRGQSRTNASETTWDHLFYINDASQRFGYATGYSETNLHGWKPIDNVTTQRALIPIEFDGVTFVNNQSKPGVKGAAIYYADQKFNEAGLRDDNGTLMARAPLSANIRRIQQYYYDKDRTANPADEPTMFEKVAYTGTDPELLKQNYYEINNPAKLIISKCKVMNSGMHNSFFPASANSSAVYIGKEGGEAILYNNVFHSNWGDPLEAYGAKLVNNTFALNKGYVVLRDYAGQNNGFNETDGVKSFRNGNVTDQDYTCSAFNNVFWRNGLDKKQDGTNKTCEFEFYDKSGTRKFGGYDVDLSLSGTFFKRNAFSGGPTSVTDYTETGTIATEWNYNVGLVADNDNVVDGPNFTNPLDDDNVSYTEAQIESRDFTLQPSLRLINKGLMDLYKNGISYNVLIDNSVTHTLSQDLTIYDFAWLPTTAHDAASKRRKIANTNAGQIDLGAYEYQNQLERVLYVNPNTAVSGSGNSWSDPIGQGNLQAAIDLAGVYCVNNPHQQAYVFVKGANVGEETHTGERITLRDGVQIYAGINPGYGIDARDNVTDDYDQDRINAYISTIKNTRLGVADPNSFKTRVSAIRTSTSTKFNPNSSLVLSFADGFVVTPVGGETPTEPAINIAPTISNNTPRIAVRNVIVSGYDLSTNVANVQNALIYEALFRDNNVADSKAVLNMGAQGYGVNLTVEGKTSGTTANVFNSLINYGDDVKRTLSGYSYPLDDSNLNYQLAEGSRQIDQCNPATSIATLPSHLASFIDYATDRDLLGNPRILALGDEATKTLDRGAFETWKVAKDVRANTTSAVYGGNYYPHTGSVVYVGEGKALVSAHDFEPGYLLIGKGASLYGNGYNVKADYVAVEREITDKGAIVAMPFAMDYKTNAAVSSHDDYGVLTLNNQAGATVWAYNGAERADWQYDFASKYSDCWEDADGTIAAGKGVLYLPNAATSTVRFTSKGTNAYTESGTSKTVELTQYNDGGRDSHDNGNTGSNTDFTEKDDMGWNAIGLPYLVSDYQTYSKVKVDEGHNLIDLLASTDNGYAAAPFLMHIPHTMWLYYDGTISPNGQPVNGNGGFYSVNSWEDTDAAWHVAADAAKSIWVGEGFFVQTAALTATETLKFYRPVVPSTLGASNRRQARYFLTEGIDEDQLQQDAEHYIVATRYYTVDGRRIKAPMHNGVTIVVDFYNDGTQRSHKLR